MVVSSNSDDSEVEEDGEEKKEKEEKEAKNDDLIDELSSEESGKHQTIDESHSKGEALHRMEDLDSVFVNEDTEEGEDAVGDEVNPLDIQEPGDSDSDDCVCMEPSQVSLQQRGQERKISNLTYDALSELCWGLK